LHIANKTLILSAVHQTESFTQSTVDLLFCWLSSQWSH